jgi:hypothetical protein
MFRLPVPPILMQVSTQCGPAPYTRAGWSSKFDEIATELTIDPAGAACVREVIEYSKFFASICFRDFAEYGAQATHKRDLI